MSENGIFIGFLTKSGEIVSEELIRTNIKTEILNGKDGARALERWKSIIKLASAHNIRLFEGGSER